MAKLIEINYERSHTDAVNTIESAHRQGEISSQRAKQYLNEAHKNYSNRNLERVAERHFSGKLKVREV